MFEAKRLRQRSELYLLLHDDGVRFLVMCLTCPVILMESVDDPESNPEKREVMILSTTSHQESFSNPHRVEKIDLQNRTSSSPLSKIKLIN